MKGIAIVLVLACSAGIGMYYCFDYLQRVNTLMQFQKVVLWVESEMKYGRLELEEIFQSLHKKTKGDVYRFIEKLLVQDVNTFQKRWECSVNTQLRSLSQCEKDEILWLGMALGKQDLESQLLQMKQYRIRTDEELLQLEKERKKYVKLYPVLAISIGMIVCLVAAG